MESFYCQAKNSDGTVKMVKEAIKDLKNRTILANTIVKYWSISNIKVKFFQFAQKLSCVSEPVIFYN